MATESKTDEKNTNEETDQWAVVDQMIERFPSLIDTLLPTAVEEPEGPRLFKSFDLASAAEYMSKCSNIVVMSGAGISTSAGIPDFRTPGTGLYSKLEQYNLPQPESIFDITYFRENPKPFFLLSKELYPKNFTPTPTHYFIRLLNEKGKLLRSFTQNIDSLERIAGIPEEKIIEAHGTFSTAHCLDCRKEFSLDYVKDIIFKDEIPYCDTCKGLIKPDVVFFSESLPQRYFEYVEKDFAKCDFLIIIGTSLAVVPFNSLTSRVSLNCPRLLINKEPVGNIPSFWLSGEAILRFDSPKNRRDIFHPSACDDGVMELAKLLGWENDFKKLLAKERKSSSTQTVCSNIVTALTQKISSVSKPAPQTVQRRSISPTKTTKITVRDQSPKKVVARTSSITKSSKFTLTEKSQKK
ncbi:hypothetical protein I4U23_015712 [Adineta vaga]|nr:hypothetical protein I4U23_015712 [Adineta vaga]